MYDENLGYDPEDANSIYNYALNLKGKTFDNIIKAKSLATPERMKAYNNLARKGGLGNLLEEVFFGYGANSDQAPDFPEAGMELKVTPFQILKNGQLSAGERLVLTMISFSEPVEDDFYRSHAWQKMAKILLIYYHRDKEILDRYKNNLFYKIHFVNLFTPPQKDLLIIKQDYDLIINKIRSGLAHELSEADTYYLGACTKGASSKSVVKQYYGNHEEAMTRAFCFKTKYMTYVLRNYIVPGEQKEESIITNVVELQSNSLADIIAKRLIPYAGMLIDNPLKQYEVNPKKDKSYNSTLVHRMLGIKGNNAEEFVKAGITLKTIRINKKGSIEQHFRLYDVKLKELAKEESWEDSELYEYLSTTQMLLIVFRETDEGYVFKGSQLWHVPVKDLVTIGEGWDAVHKCLNEGVVLTPVVQANGKTIVKNNLPGTKDNPIFHIRPHATLGFSRLSDGSEYGSGSISNSDELPDGQLMTKQSYWLHKNYILSQLNDDLKNG